MLLHWPGNLSSSSYSPYRNCLIVLVPSRVPVIALLLGPSLGTLRLAVLGRLGCPVPSCAPAGPGQLSSFCPSHPMVHSTRCSCHRRFWACRSVPVAAEEHTGGMVREHGDIFHPLFAVHSALSWFLLLQFRIFLPSWSSLNLKSCDVKHVHQHNNPQSLYTPAIGLFSHSSQPTVCSAGRHAAFCITPETHYSSVLTSSNSFFVV